jgi:putative DNA primase/helicase
MELIPRLPHNTAAEQALLGAILINPDTVGIISSIISPHDFFTRGHQRIFRAMQSMKARGMSIDLVLLHDELLNDDEVNGLGGAAYLSSLSDGVHSKAPVAEWAVSVRDDAVLRGIAAAGQKLADGALQPGATVGEMVRRAQIVANSIPGEFQKNALVSVTVEELLQKDIKRREMLLNPILPVKGLVMMYSYRGVGKTFLALAIGHGVAAGTGFLKWGASRPRKVLYVDGELPEKTIQERSALIVAAMDGMGPAPGQLRIITPDEQPGPMPDIGTRQGQDLIEPHLEGVDLLILDNLSALCRHGKENEGEGWLPVQEWLLSLRRRGLTVLFLHHAGKNNSQRGTSRREDLLDIVITLKHPGDYGADEGLRAELHFEKTRGLLGVDAKPFEIRFGADAYGKAVWSYRDLDDVREKRAELLFAQGMSIREVADELHMSKSAVGRYHKRLVAKFGVNEPCEVSQCPVA